MAVLIVGDMRMGIPELVLPQKSQKEGLQRRWIVSIVTRVGVQSVYPPFATRKGNFPRM